MTKKYESAYTWTKSEPIEQSLQPKAITQLHSTILSEYDNIRGIVIVRNSCIVYEEYFNNHDYTTPIHVASVTKSILSALIGIAVDKGYIKSQKQTVLEFFPDFKSINEDDNRRNITLEDLLTMTAPYSFEDWKEPLEEFCNSSDWVQYALDKLGQNGKIGTFKYSTMGAHLLSAILTKATGKSTLEFANEFLFTPAGMRNIPDYIMHGYGYEDLFGRGVRGWVHDPHNIVTGGWGLTMTVRDMARFGLLYLNKGKLEDKQIVSPNWIEMSTKPNKNNHGYMWWLFEDKEITAYAAMGDGGNTICCIPSKNMVIAIASEFMFNPKDRWLLIKDHIIPAIKD